MANPLNRWLQEYHSDEAGRGLGLRTESSQGLDLFDDSDSAGTQERIWSAFLAASSRRIPGRYDPALLPVACLHATGYEGQFVSVVASRRLVVARLGLARLVDAWDQEVFLHRILQAIEQEPP